MANYRLCRELAHPKPEPGVRPHIRNVSLVNVTAPPGGAWRTGKSFSSLETRKKKGSGTRHAVCAFGFRLAQVGCLDGTGWLNCLPESPCEDIVIDGVVAPGALPWVCEHVHGRAAGAAGAENVPSASNCFAN